MENSNSLNSFRIFLSNNDRSNPHSSEPIDPYLLKHLVLNGIPDSPFHLRPSIWRILLGIISTEERPIRWNCIIEKRRDDYQQLLNYFTNQLIHQPESSSKESNPFHDRILSLIDSDVIRTQKNLLFFNNSHSIDSDRPFGFKLKAMIDKLNLTNRRRRQSSNRLSVLNQSNLTINTNLNLRSRPQSILPPSPITPKLSVQAPSPTSSSNGNPELEVPQIKVIQNQSTEENLNFTYRDLLTRLLAVWSALNPGIGYVQGMNHIGAVLIYVFSQSDSKTQRIRQERVRSNDPYHSDERVDDDSDHFENVEADAFWAFNSLMSPIRDLFIKSFDSDQSISRPSQMSPGVQSSLGFARVLSRYKSQLFRMEPDLAKRFESIDLDPRDYLIDWLGCLFCRCFHLPDLVRIWDSILAIKLDTSTHQAQRMSEEVDSNQVLDYLVDLSCVMTLKVKQMPEFHDVSKIEFDEIVLALQNFREQADVNVDQIIQESLLLRQQRLAEDLNDDLPLGSFGKAQKTSLEEENEDEPHWEEDIDEGGWDEYEGPRIGASINSLASRFAWTSSSQQKPQLDLSVPQKRDSLQENKNLTDEQPSLLAKLMSKAEGWKDSDAAATFSKKATNWTILASSWRPPSLISDMNSVDSNSNNISGIGGAREAYIKASENGTASSPSFTQSFSKRNSSGSSYSSPTVTTRWSKHSYTSTVSGDSSVQLPAMSSNTSSDQASSSCSSPPLGSPLRSNHFNSNGPRPLLLSSRVRTNVITENKSEGLVQQILTTPLMKRLSGINLRGATSGIQVNGEYYNVELSSERTPTSARFKSTEKLSPQWANSGINSAISERFSESSNSVTILGGNRYRARSVLSSPVRSIEQDLGGRKPERSSLPHGHRLSTIMVHRPITRPEEEDENVFNDEHKENLELNVKPVPRRGNINRKALMIDSRAIGEYDDQNMTAVRAEGVDLRMSDKSGGCTEGIDLVDDLMNLYK